MPTHKSPISGVAAFGRRWIATAGYDNRVILWDEGNSVAVNYHDHLVNACHFHPSGELLVTASSDRTARVWRVPFLELVATLHGHEDDVEMANFSPDGSMIATASRDGCVRVFDQKGSLLATLKGHTADVTSLAWSADGKSIISSSDDGTVRLWSVTEFSELERIQLDGVETDTVAITGDRTVVAGNDNGEICVLKDGTLTRVKAHSAGIKRLVLSSDERQLLSLSYDRHLCVFDVDEGRLAQTHRLPYPTSIWARSASFMDPHTVIFGSFGDTYAKLDLPTGKFQTDHIGETFGINTIQNSPDGLITVGDAGCLKIHNAGAAKQLFNFNELCNFIVPFHDRFFVGGQTGRIYTYPSGSLFADLMQPLNCGVTNGKNLIVGGYTGEIFILSTETGAILFQNRILKNAIKSIALSDHLGLAVGAARDLCWFNPETGEPIQYVEEAHAKIANGCAFLREKTFVSVSRDRLLRIFTFGSDRVEVIPTPVNHSAKCVATDGKRIAVGSYGGQVAVFDTEAKKWTYNERPTRSGISSIAYRPEDQTFYAASYDGGVYPIRSP